MAYEEHFCGMCGRKTEYGLCSSCNEKYDRERERIKERIEQEEFIGYHDTEINEALQKKFNIHPITVRYCQYQGSCGNKIENSWEDICPSCKERSERSEKEEKERWERFKDSI